MFWTAAHSATAYGPDNPFVNPPTALIWFKLLFGVPYWIGFTVWTCLSICAFVAASNKAFDLAPTLLAFVSPVLLKALLLGQSTLLLGAAILFAFMAPPVIGGIVLGTVASIKPQLLLMAPLALLVRRDWRMLFAAIGGGLISLLFSLAAFGIDAWVKWYLSLPHWHQVLIDTNVLKNAVAPAAYAEWEGLSPLPFWVAGIAFAILATVRSARSCERGYLAALIVGASAIAAPYSLPHDLVIFVPLVLLALFRMPRPETIPAMLVFAGVALPISLPVALVVLIPRGLGLREDLHLSGSQSPRGSNPRPGFPSSG